MWPAAAAGPPAVGGGLGGESSSQHGCHEMAWVSNCSPPSRDCSAVASACVNDKRGERTGKWSYTGCSDRSPTRFRLADNSCENGWSIGALTEICSSSSMAQWLTFCQEEEQDSVNVASSTPAQPPGTLFRQTFTTLLIRVLTTDYCWRSWTSRIAAPYKSRVDWLIDYKNSSDECASITVHSNAIQVRTVS